jgi:hypothetical protein
MSATEQRTGHTTEETYEARNRHQPTAWVGLIVFGGVMMLMMGGFQIIMGIVALVRDEYYLVTRSGLLFTFDFTVWGWIHLVIGVAAVAAGFGVLMGAMWARVIGIVIAVVSALANIAFLSAYPIWSLIVIAADVLVIYALTVHGAETKNR